MDSDWDFMDDVPYFMNTPLSIIFNQTPTEEEYMRLAKILEGDGFVWSNSRDLPTKWSPLRYWDHGGLIYLDTNKRMTQSPTTSQHFQERVKTSNELINYKDLIK